jgi:CRISPR-associated protein Csb1
MPDSIRTPLTLELLRKLVEDDAVAIRGTATLEPAGGPSDKVFPPSHSVDKNERGPGAKYAFEKRRIDGREVESVLIDSVQSQANRMEEALQALWADKRIALPVIAVDFSTCAPDVGIVTSLSAPHRVADALLRDSLVDGTLFRLSEIGRSFADATIKDAAPLFKVCPTGLVFGLWDSTGPRGGKGAKFARSVVSEIVGIGAISGKKTESRIDPAGIETASGVLYIQKHDPKVPMKTWTLSAEEAELDGGVPLKWGSKLDKNGKWKQGSGRPSEANHSNIPPSIDTLAGGVTIDRASHTVVLSLAALRKLGFGGGDIEARTVLAALGLLAVLAAESRGHDLRSRCLLVPRKGESLTLHAVRRDGETEELGLDLNGAIALFNAAVAALPEPLRFSTKPGEPLVTLTPSPKLAHLVARSRELASTGADVDGD